MAAEKLFAERGIDDVSMREIGREAGQRNNSALVYHFGSKQEVIYQVVRVRMTSTDNKRGALVDEIEAANRQHDVRALAEAIVWPLAQHLVSGQTTSYIRMLAAAQIHPDLDLVAATRDLGGNGFRRVLAHLRTQLPYVPETILRQRFLAVVSFVMFSLADYERIKSRAGRLDLERAIQNLIDMVAGALSAEVSKAVISALKE